MIQAVFESRRWRAEECGDYWTRREVANTALMSCVHRFLRLPLTLSIPLKNLQAMNQS